MLKVALTGGIGCGKTTVCDFFSELNAPIIDTDDIAKQLVAPGQPALNEIISIFGESVLTPHGDLDRAKLSEIIFSSPSKKQQLEAVLHPKIRNVVKDSLNALTTPYAIVAIPLLFETNQQNSYDRILLVDCDEQQQLERTLARDTRSKEQVLSIMKAQVSRQTRLQLADDIIINTGKIDDLKVKVAELDRFYTTYARSGK
jgi:dephospho-CoA kinase